MFDSSDRLCLTGGTKRLHDTIVGPTSRTDQSDRPVGPTIVRPVSGAEMERSGQKRVKRERSVERDAAERRAGVTKIGLSAER